MHDSYSRLVEASGGMSPADLARALNESPQTVNNWSKRGVSKAGALTAEKVFGRSSLWILDGETGDAVQKQTQSGISQKQIQSMNFIPPVDLTHSDNPKQTPVLSWVQAGDFSYVLSSDLSSAIDWIPYDARAGQYGFALIVKGVSMEPDFKPDEFIYVNPTYQIDELNTGALVVMACDGDSEATFKELVAEDGDYYLRPLNPNWKPQLIQVDHTCRLVGKVVGKYTRY